MLWYCSEKKNLYRVLFDQGIRAEELFIFSKAEFMLISLSEKRYDALGIVYTDSTLPTAYARQITLEEIIENPDLWSSNFEYLKIMQVLI